MVLLYRRDRLDEIIFVKGGKDRCEKQKGKQYYF